MLSPHDLRKLSLCDGVCPSVEVVEALTTLHVQDFSKSQFGWVFPDVIDETAQRDSPAQNTEWFDDYDLAVDNLKTEIQRQKSNSFNHMIDCLKDTLPVISDDLISKSVLKDLNDSGLEEEEEMAKLAKDVTELVLEKNVGDIAEVSLSVLGSNETEGRSDTPISEACISLNSFMSRDSGVCASDDVSEVSREGQTDRSLLEELEELISNESGEISTSFKGENALEKSIALDDKANKCKQPLWFHKFTLPEADISVELSPPLKLSDSPSVGTTAGHVSKRETISGYPGIRKPSLMSEYDEQVEDTTPEESRRRQHLRSLWRKCDRLETCNLWRKSTSSSVQPFIQLVDDFTRIDERLQVLRCGLDSLMIQASDNRRDYKNLHTRTSKLLMSTEAAREHLSQVYALEQLEARLMREWWASHNPDLSEVHDSYIV